MNASHPRYLKIVLTHAEEQEAIVKAQQGDTDARNMLVERHMPFVIKVARRVHQRMSSDYAVSFDIDDLAQSGAIGFMRGIEKYEFNLGANLITYAMHWVSHYMSAYIEANGGIVRLPAYIIATKNALARAERQHGVGSPEYENAIKSRQKTLGLPREAILQIAAIALPSRSAIRGFDDDTSLASGRAASADCDPGQDLADAEVVQLAVAAIESMSGLDRAVASRFLPTPPGAQRLSMSAIAREFRVTKHLARKAERRAREALAPIFADPMRADGRAMPRQRRSNTA